MIRKSIGSSRSDILINIPGPIALSPTDATTYFFGTLSFVSVAGYNRIYLHNKGLLQAVHINFTTTGTLGSNENSSVYIRLNDTTDYLISSAVDVSSTFLRLSVENLNVPIAVNDFIELKWVTPTWATNPISVYISATVHFK